MPKPNKKEKESKYFNIEASSDEDEGVSSSKYSQYTLSKKKLGIEDSDGTDSNGDYDLDNEVSNEELNGEFSDAENDNLDEDFDQQDDEDEGTNSKSPNKKELLEKLKNDEFFKVQTVEYIFNVHTTSKREKIVLDSKHLKINSASCRDDFDSISTLKTPLRASQNADIILHLEIRNLETDYPGNVKIDFPTVKQLNNFVGYQGEKYISYQKSDKKDRGNILFDRTLDEGKKSFLRSFPGNTCENFDVLCKETHNKKTIVGLKPTSCIMYYFNEAKDISDKTKKGIMDYNYKRKNTDGFEMTTKLYKHLQEKAIDNLEKNFSFSDISSNKFKIMIYPLMSSTTQSAINKTIKKLESDTKTDNKEVLTMLKKKGFANFYNTNPQTNVDLKSQCDAFEKQEQRYNFKGSILISYFQVKKPVKK